MKIKARDISQFNVQRTISIVAVDTQWLYVS